MDEVSLLLTGKINYVPKVLGGTSFAQVFVGATQAGALLSIARSVAVQARMAKIDTLIRLRQLQLQEAELASKYAGTPLAGCPSTLEINHLTVDALNAELEGMTLTFGYDQKKELSTSVSAHYNPYNNLDA
jgi:hypothetical protein